MARFLILCGLTLMFTVAGFAQSDTSDWLTIRRDDLCVTEGAIEKTAGERMSVDVPKMRALVTASSEPSIELRFRYAGATEKKSALGSGQMRQQFGLKLQAQDPCNLVYAMWRIEPESQLVVSVKRNPAEHTSAQCTNHGYTNIKASKTSPLPRLGAGESHTLRAEMKKDELHVFVDNREVWDGEVGSDAARLDGPVGLRSDNAQLEFDLKVRRSKDRREPWPCKPGDSD